MATRNKKKDKMNNNGRKSHSSTTVKHDKRAVDDWRREDATKGNDPSWYNRFPELVQTSANLSWQVSLGNRYNFNPVYDANPRVGLSSAAPVSDTGIHIFSFIPTYGAGSSINNPINKTALELYSILRYNKSGNPGYDPADVMQVIIGMDSVYMFISCCMRVYGLLNRFEPINKYVSRSYVTALGFNYDDLIEHKAEFAAFINTMILQTGKINVPKDVTIFDRHDLLCANVFKDEDIARSTDFAFNPLILWQYDEVNARLVPIDFAKGRMNGTNLLTLNSLRTMGNGLINHIQLVEDFYTINANILSAYGAENLKMIGVMDTLYYVYSIYRREVSNQMHNATFMGHNYDAATMYITQNMEEGSPDLGAVEFEPYFTTSVIPYYESMVDIPWENISIDDVMEATRFKVYAAPESLVDGRVYGIVKTCGSEIMCDWVAWTFDGNGTLVSSNISVNGSFSRDLEYTLGSSLDWHPQHLSVTTAETGDPEAPYTYTPANIIGEISNYAILSGDALEGIHQAALYSMLSISRGNVVSPMR